MSYLADFAVPTFITMGLMAVIGWLSRKYIGQFLTSSARHIFDERLERLKSDLTSERETALALLSASFNEKIEVQRAALATYASGQEKLHERRLDACERVWQDFLKVRQVAPEVLLHADILKPEELRNHLSISEDTTSVDDKMVNVISKLDQEIETARLYIGDYVWALYNAYRAINIRTAYILRNFHLDSELNDWRNDEIIQKLIENTLSNNEMDKLEKMTVNRLTYINKSIERKILLGMSSIISGEKTSADFLEQAGRISEIVDSFSINRKRNAEVK